MSGFESKDLSAQTLSLILTNFEGSNDIIERTFRQNADFRSLCEDYYTCHQALKRWQVSGAAAAAQRQQEYTEWLTELEQDVRDWLKRSYAVPLQTHESRNR